MDAPHHRERQWCSPVRGRPPPDRGRGSDQARGVEGLALPPCQEAPLHRLPEPQDGAVLHPRDRAVHPPAAGSVETTVIRATPSSASFAIGLGRLVEGFHSAPRLTRLPIGPSRPSCHPAARGPVEPYAAWDQASSPSPRDSSTGSYLTMQEASCILFLMMEGRHDSLSALRQLLETWAEGARDTEIERLIQALKDELRRRGYDIRCEVMRKAR